jgi:hypothetical protein
MTSQTPNHSWTVPDIDETGWGPVLLALYDDLDESVPTVDTQANRPAAADAETFIQTDSAGDGPGYYVSDGNSWTLVAAPPRPMGQALADGLIVVVADGTYTTFDPTGPSVLTTAFDTAGAAGGGTIYLPPTTVPMNSNVNWHDNCSLIGVPGRSTLSVPGTFAPAFVFQASSSSYSTTPYIDNVRLDNVLFDGPGSGEFGSAPLFDDRGYRNCYKIQ